ncbi:MAG: 50S ribosomal protein L15 [bacterium]|nr:50S ribosomal protein L15 [bacterium]
MQSNQLKPNKNKKSKRIGRGGKKGTTSGKGTKGQSSRAGRRFEPLIRQFIKKYPKLRGYRFHVMPKNFVAVNLDEINELFAEKEVVNSVTLLKKKAIVFPGNKIPQVKILGRGEITKALVFQNCLLSKSAREKIEKAKCKIKE